MFRDGFYPGIFWLSAFGVWSGIGSKNSKTGSFCMFLFRDFGNKNRHVARNSQLEKGFGVVVWMFADDFFSCL